MCVTVLHVCNCTACVCVRFSCRRFLFQDAPSVTVIREPVSRLISAFHYRGHSPNLDFFQVRKEFKMIKDGLIPKVRH